AQDGGGVLVAIDAVEAVLHDLLGQQLESGDAAQGRGGLDVPGVHQLLGREVAKRPEFAAQRLVGPWFVGHGVPGGGVSRSRAMPSMSAANRSRCISGVMTWGTPS